MKTKLALVVMAVLLALALFACSPAGKEVAVDANYSEFVQEKDLARNAVMTSRDTIKVTLPSNPSTGFKWALSDISDPAVLEQSGESEYVLPDSSLVGSAGEEVWTFKPVGRGTSTIVMEYSQPWENGTKKEWTMTIEVKVR